MTDNELEILLVEDNPGDARLIEEMLNDHEPLAGRFDDTQPTDASTHEHAVMPLSTVSETLPSLTHVTRLSAGLDQLGEETDDTPDVVLLDLNLPDSEGLETLKTVHENADSIPTVVLTGLEDRHFGVQALHCGAHEYLVKDEINSDLLIRSIYHAIERAAYERQLTAQKDRLETLNHLNALVQDITQVLIEQSTREKIESAVCEQLATADLYASAWIGDSAHQSEQVSLRTEADVDGALDGDTNPTDADVLECELTNRAVHTQEVQVARHLSDHDDSESDSWRAHARDLGYQAAAAIPIVYEQTPYGVLTVYSTRPGAFDSEERAVIGRLGEIIGHAINAVEAKKRLLADTVVELEFECTDPALFFNAASDHLGCTFRLDRVVPAAGGDLLYYITVKDASPEDVLDEASRMPAVERARLIEEGYGDESIFEFTLTGSSVIQALTRQGAKVTTAIAEQGTAQFTAEVAPQSDVRPIVDAITASYSNVEFIARRDVDRPIQTREESRDVLEETLTERQRATVQAAYFAGFFDWPRESTGEEVADSLGVSAPTFHQHLRHAQEGLISVLLDGMKGGGYLVVR